MYMYIYIYIYVYVYIYLAYTKSFYKLYSNFYSIKQITFNILYNKIYHNWDYSSLRKTHEER